MEKHLTKERGYVPAKLLSVEANYTLYVKRKLQDKIEKLNVFESECMLVTWHFLIKTKHNLVIFWMMYINNLSHLLMT